MTILPVPAVCVMAVPFVTAFWSKTIVPPFVPGFAGVEYADKN